MGKKRQAKKAQKKAQKRIDASVKQTKDWAAPKVEGALTWAETNFGDTLDNAQKFTADAVDKLQNDVWPEAAGKAASAANKAAAAIGDAELPDSVHSAVTKVTGDKKKAKKLQKAAEDYAKSAEKKLKKESKKGKSKKWLVLGVVVAAGGASYAVYKLSKPVEDPWKNPTPQPLKQNTPAASKPAAHVADKPAESEEKAEDAAESKN